MYSKQNERKDVLFNRVNRAGNNDGRIAIPIRFHLLTLRRDTMTGRGREFAALHF